METLNSLEDIKPPKKRRYMPRIALYCLTTGLLTLAWVYTSHLTVIAYASAMESYQEIRASITERFRSVEYIREYVPREQKPIATIVREAAKRHGISAMLLTALITQESGQQLRTDRMRYEPHLQGKFKCPTWMNPDECRAQATSWGLGQVIPGFWAKHCGLSSYSDLLDPEINLNCSASILADCLKRRANVTDKMERYRQCLQAYNGSPAYPPQVFEHLTRIIVEQQL